MANSNNILDFKAEATFVACIFAMKSCLSGFLDWESDNKNNPEIVGDFLKRVSKWHGTSIKAGMEKTKEFLQNDNFSSTFASKCVDELWHKITNDGAIIGAEELHIELLLSATRELKSLFVGNVIDSSTAIKIVEWFTMLQHPKRVFVTTKFDNLVTSFFDDHRQPRDGWIGNGVKYACFHPEILFIYIAHLVNFHTSTTEQASKFKVNDFEDWERKSSDMFQQIFTVGNSLKAMTLGPDLPTANIGFVIPVGDIAVKIQKDGVTTAPTFIESHVLNVMYKAIMPLKEDLQSETQDLQEFKRFGELMTAVHHGTADNIKRTKAAEKVRRHCRKKNGAKHVYHPVHPKYYERDIFIMGKDSYYHHFCTEEGEKERNNPFPGL